VIGPVRLKNPVGVDPRDRNTWTGVFAAVPFHETVTCPYWLVVACGASVRVDSGMAFVTFDQLSGPLEE
jgi:hypothetical protein